VRKVRRLWTGPCGIAARTDFLAPKASGGTGCVAIVTRDVTGWLARNGSGLTTSVTLSRAAQPPTAIAGKTVAEVLAFPQPGIAASGPQGRCAP
jgi:hypothetical protein